MDVQDYLRRINVKKYKKERDFFWALNKSTEDKEAIQRVIEIISNRAEDDTNDNVYNAKNKYLSLAKVINGNFDYSHYMTSLQWISDHSDLFGKTILDVGCDIGITSCFIALLVPDSKVVGIDTSENGVRCAWDLAKELNLKNVSFECINLNSISLDEKYASVYPSLAICAFQHLYSVPSFLTNCSPPTVPVTVTYPQPDKVSSTNNAGNVPPSPQVEGRNAFTVSPCSTVAPPQILTHQSVTVVPSGNSKYNLTEVSAFAGTGVTASDVNTIANAINRLSSRFLIGSLFLSPTIFFLSFIYELFSSICPIRTLNHFEFFMQKKHYKLDYRN